MAAVARRGFGRWLGAVLLTFAFVLPGVAYAQAPDIVYLGAWPNPVQAGSGTDIIFDLDRETVVDVSIVRKEDGRLVRQLAKQAFPRLRTTLKWDGKDAQGQPVPAGHYVVVAATERNGTRTPVQAPLFVEGSAPGAAQPAPATVANKLTRQIVLDSYQHAFGRAASDDEVAFWLGLPGTDARTQSYEALLGWHRQFLQQSEGERRATVQRALVAVYRVEQPPAAVDLWSTTLLNGRFVYREVLRRMVLGASYQQAFGRQPTFDETTYWLQQPETEQTLTLAGMLGLHRQYIANNPGVRQDIVRQAVRTGVGPKYAVVGREGEWEALLAGEPFDYQRMQYRAIIEVAFAETFGRAPEPSYLQYWMDQFEAPNPDLDRSLGATIEALRVRMRNDWAARQDALNRAFLLAYGREPDLNEQYYWDQALEQSGFTILDMIRVLHVDRSYKEVFFREPTVEEMNYWLRVVDPELTLNYESLVAQHLEWLQSAIVAIAPGDIAGLPPATLREVGVRRLSLDQVRELSQEQLDALFGDLTRTQIRALSPHQVQQIAPDRLAERLADLQPLQVAVLSLEQVQALTVEQLASVWGSLSAVQVAALSPETFAALGPERFGADQLLLIQPEQIRRVGTQAFSPDQVAAFPASSVLAIGAGSFSESQIAAFARVQSNLLGLEYALLIGFDGATLIGNDAGSLIGSDGATLIGNDAGSLIGFDGATILVNNGGNIVAAGAGNIVAAGAGNVLSHNGGALSAGAGGLVIAPGAGVISTGGNGVIGNGGAGIVRSGMGGADLAQLGAQLTAAQRAGIVAAGAGNIVAAGAGN